MKDEIKFPAGFLWGAATSSHQVEGNNRNNDWWRWEERGKAKELSGRACNQYELFKNDFKLAHSMHHNAHRFSLEWSRIEPIEGRFDGDAINHYREVIRTLRSLGITPVVTLNHFTLPIWFAEKGGWIGERCEHVFANFAEKAALEFGMDVKYWLTLNEAVGQVNSAYVVGDFPPGRHSFKEAGKAIVNILKAHALAYKAINKVYKDKGWPAPKISIAKFTVRYTPCRPNSKADLLAARLRHYYTNKFLIESLINGWCLAPGLPPAKLALKGTLDFIGLNYYTREYIHFSGLLPPKIFGEICSLTHHRNSGKRNFLQWEIHPRGLYGMIMEMSRYGLPILITENGICTNDDNERIDFIKDHIREAGRAIANGAPVFGYLYWSLLDNFEWTHGFGPRFGLIEVDYATQRRTIKPSGRIYAEIIRKNAI